MSYCNDNRLAVCPQGGNTAVNGNGIPIFDEIVISAELLNNIISIDEFSGENTIKIFYSISSKPSLKVHIIWVFATNSINDYDQYDEWDGYSFY